MSTILLIEDDPFVVEWIKRLVDRAYGRKVNVEVISSERHFLVRMPALSSVNAIIVDLMLPWEDGVPIPAADKEYLEPRGDHLVAGTRIIQDLLGNSNLQHIPTLFYTVNDKPANWDHQQAPPNLTYMRKDEPDERFMAWVRDALVVGKVH